MAKDADKIAREMIEGSFEELMGGLPHVEDMPEPTPEEKAARKRGGRRSTTASGHGRRTLIAPEEEAGVTGREDWRRLVPSSETPHVYSVLRADERLRSVRRRVRVKDGVATFDADAWAFLVGEVARVMLDVAEGGGLVVKDGAVLAKARVVVARLMREDMRFAGDDGAYSKVAIE